MNFNISLLSFKICVTSKRVLCPGRISRFINKSKTKFPSPRTLQESCSSFLVLWSHGLHVCLHLEKEFCLCAFPLTCSLTKGLCFSFNLSPIKTALRLLKHGTGNRTRFPMGSVPGCKHLVFCTKISEEKL